MLKFMEKNMFPHNSRIFWNIHVCYVFKCAFLAVLLKDCIISDATRTQEGEDGGGGGGEGFRNGAPAPPFPRDSNPVPQQPGACAQTAQPSPQFLPGWLPVNNIHVGGASQSNCTALEELVAKVTRQNELSQRILSEIENIPKSQRDFDVGGTTSNKLWR
ncbi:uncharacterized protein LOC121427949 [Lytechinus variegatus]|uniref:uncharacterized protein LOC121427949 n=1 Tax=Lytechinus variegatus TaxID=7654 RepID=UPI001BB1B455|nr:uncharacterized protein LOC121427949 [Lytechinus variegatus]